MRLFIVTVWLLSGDSGPLPGSYPEEFCTQMRVELNLFSRVRIDRELPGRLPFTDYIVKAECTELEVAQS